MSNFLTLLLETSMPAQGINWWTIAAVFIGPMLSFGTAYIMFRLNLKTAETKEEKKKRIDEETAVITADKALQEWKRGMEKQVDGLGIEMRRCAERMLQLIKQQNASLRQAETTRQLKDLTVEKDIAQITSILEKSTEVQSQQLSITNELHNLRTNDARHDKNHDNLDKKITIIQQNIVDLSSRHPLKTHAK